MEVFDSILLGLHVAAGFSSIVLFWLPMLSRKGSQLHIKSGKIYVAAMWGVVVTAAILSVNNVISGDIVAAGFLGFLSVLTAVPLWYGIQVLKQKREVTNSYFRLRRNLHLLLVIASVGLLAWAIALKFEGMAILLLIFGLFGLTSIKDVFLTFDQVKSRPWIIEHLTGMLNTAIAAHTAFLVFGGANFFGQIFTGYSMIILWVAPGIVGTLIIVKMSRQFRPQAKSIPEGS